jgi:hypothetical protein
MAGFVKIELFSVGLFSCIVLPATEDYNCPSVAAAHLPRMFASVLRQDNETPKAALHELFCHFCATKLEQDSRRVTCSTIHPRAVSVAHHRRPARRPTASRMRMLRLEDWLTSARRDISAAERTLSAVLSDTFAILSLRVPRHDVRGPDIK